jgi:hypothetical protein
MLQLDNRTDWSAGLYPGWGRNRQRQQTLVFKVGYSFDAQGTLSHLPQPPIEEADRYRSDPENSSLVAASEIVPFKKGGEFLLHGSAHPVGPGESVLRVQVSLRQRNDEFWSKELRVFGRRSWQRKLFTVMPGTPERIEEPVALIYENAYGGFDPRNLEACFRANLAGVGFSLRGFRTKGLTLPQIECGPHFITGPASRVSPAGFGPLAPHWEPRSKEAANIDIEAIEFGGCPWSKEPSEALYNAAPLDQRFERPFEGVLTLQLKGLVADAPLDVMIHLPKIEPHIFFSGRADIEIPPPKCDTLIIDTDRRQIHLVWRSALPLDIENPIDGWIVLSDPESEADQVDDPVVENSQEVTVS